MEKVTSQTHLGKLLKEQQKSNKRYDLLVGSRWTTTALSLPLTGFSAKMAVVKIALLAGCLSFKLQSEVSQQGILNFA